MRPAPLPSPRSTVSPPVGSSRGEGATTVWQSLRSTTSPPAGSGRGEGAHVATGRPPALPPPRPIAPAETPAGAQVAQRTAPAASLPLAVWLRPVPRQSQRHRHAGLLSSPTTSASCRCPSAASSRCPVARTHRLPHHELCLLLPLARAAGHAVPLPPGVCAQPAPPVLPWTRRPPPYSLQPAAPSPTGYDNLSPQQLCASCTGHPIAWAPASNSACCRPSLPARRALPFSSCRPHGSVTPQWLTTPARSDTEASDPGAGPLDPVVVVPDPSPPSPRARCRHLHLQASHACLLRLSRGYAPPPPSRPARCPGLRRWRGGREEGMVRWRWLRLRP